METKELIEIARSKGMKNTGLFVEFMNKRFPTELHDSYAKEWADRFMSGNPVVYMDGLSKSIFKELLMR